MGRTGPRRALVTAIDIHHCAARGALRVGQRWDPWGQVCTGILEHHSQWGLISPSPFPPAQFLGPTTLLGLPQPMGASSATRPQRTCGCRCLAHHQPRPRKPQQVSKHHPHVNLQSNKTTPKAPACASGGPQHVHAGPHGSRSPPIPLLSQLEGPVVPVPTGDIPGGPRGLVRTGVGSRRGAGSQRCQPWVQVGHGDEPHHGEPSGVLAGLDDNGTGKAESGPGWAPRWHRAASGVTRGCHLPRTAAGSPALPLPGVVHVLLCL